MRGEEELDLDRVLEALERHAVRYVAVGGIAALAHGSPLPTTDFDLCPEATPDNLDRLAAALTDLRARLAPPDVEPLDVPLSGAFLRAFVSASFVTDAGDLDVVLRPDGIPNGYQGLAPRAVEVPFGATRLVVAALDDIIKSKRAAGRPKDLGALPYLEQLRDLT